MFGVNTEAYHTLQPKPKTILQQIPTALTHKSNW